MYVSNELNSKLDEIIKQFEVALRTYLADKIIIKFSDENSFKNHLEDLNNNHHSSSIIFSSKIKAILKEFIKNYTQTYQMFIDALYSKNSKDYSNNINVPYVKDLIYFITLLFKDLEELKDMTNNYTTIEELLYKCSLYHRVRNDLSHPASRKVLKKEASDVLKLILKFIDVVDDDAFWFISKDEIIKNIDNYYNQEKNKILKYNNLRNINVSHEKTLCRESELKVLHNLILGEDQYSRVSDSTVVFGYGGVGKTALVLDFIYEVIQKMQEEEYQNKYDFILFFSSKEERLVTTKTTGEFDIDKINVDIHSCDEIIQQILSSLNMKKFEELRTTRFKGLIVIDNIENLKEEDKIQIFDFIRKVPRSIQFILTSRSEEKAEEKIHLSEFRDFERGKEFIQSYIDSHNFNLIIDDEEIETLLSATKGNTLLLVQSLQSLNDETTTIQNISNELNNYESSSFEKVANFMYKNTFDSAIKELNDEGLDPQNIILLATLYRIKIDLYSLSKLTDIKINDVRKIANHLTSKLIFNKTEEFYTVNEFASKFIFISLMPDDNNKRILETKIEKYKNNLTQKLSQLENQMQENPKIHTIITDWKPNNYIDKIVIAEVFQMYNKFILAIKEKNEYNLKLLFNEYEKHEYTTKHPYIRFQKARIINAMIQKRYYGNSNKENRILEIKRCYEDTLESINTSYSYIKNTVSHTAVLMLFGFFLNRNLKDKEKAVRYLEMAKKIKMKKTDRKFFLIRNELSFLYKKIYSDTKDKYYKDEYNIIYNEIINSNINSSVFSIIKYKEQFKRL